MIYMWFTGINYYKLAVERDGDSNFYTTNNKFNTCSHARLRSSGSSFHNFTKILPASEESTNMTRIIMRFRQGSQRCAIRAPHLPHEYKRHIDCLLSTHPGNRVVGNRDACWCS
jgi:hypothetical protein